MMRFIKKVTFVTNSHTQAESGLWLIAHCNTSFCFMFSRKMTVGDETGFVQVSTAAIAGGMVVPITSCVFVFQNKSISQVDFESSGLLFEHGLQWSL